ncbi:class I SAM-dependent methyltransferase [bacterium]|nr:class I SAM-dependent methyltransferase [bacterium]
MSERYNADESRKTGADAPHTFRYYCARGFVEPNDVILDCACGTGYGTELLSRSLCDRVYGIDYSTDAIRTAALTHSNEKTVFHRTDLNSANISSIPHCDYAVSIETLEHLEDPLRFLTMLFDRTRRALFLSTPVIPTMHGNEFHKHDWDANGVKKLISEAGWVMFHEANQGGTYGLFVALKP